jgi:hypothetical protein
VFCLVRVLALPSLVALRRCIGRYNIFALVLVLVFGLVFVFVLDVFTCGYNESGQCGHGHNQVFGFGLSLIWELGVRARM